MKAAAGMLVSFNDKILTVDDGGDPYCFARCWNLARTIVSS